VDGQNVVLRDLLSRWACHFRRAFVPTRDGNLSKTFREIAASGDAVNKVQWMLSVELRGDLGTLHWRLFIPAKQPLRAYAFLQLVRKLAEWPIEPKMQSGRQRKGTIPFGHLGRRGF
jgi:hypothetical protein